MKELRCEIRFVVMLFMTLLVFSGCTKKIATIEDISPSSFTRETKPEVEVDNAVKGIGGDEVVTEPLALLDSGIDENAIEPWEISDRTVEMMESPKRGERAAITVDLRDVFFDFDMAVLREGEIDTLKKNAEWLKKNRPGIIRIEGYADERGTSEYNLALGEKRAQMVKKYLMVLGITPSRIDIISYGEEKDFCAEHNEDCWAQNRRGHFVTVERPEVRSQM